MFSWIIHSKNLLLLREAFASLLPIILVMNTLVLLVGFNQLLASWGISSITVIHGDEF
jgi:hypothetical protein